MASRTYFFSLALSVMLNRRGGSTARMRGGVLGRAQVPPTGSWQVWVARLLCILCLALPGLSFAAWRLPKGGGVLKGGKARWRSNYLAR